MYTFDNQKVLMSNLHLLQTLLLSSVFSILLLSTTTSSTNVGVNYDPSYHHLPLPHQVAEKLTSLGVETVRVIHPNPFVLEAFYYSDITLLLSVPNELVNSFAVNRSAASEWLFDNIVIVYPMARIVMISVGADISTLSNVLIPAMRHLRQALDENGIEAIAVSTIFSFDKIMSMLFPPFTDSKPQIYDLLDFLEEGNSSLLVNIYPYYVYRRKIGFPISNVTGVNLFDVMVDSIVAALAISGHENIRLTVTETGWPSSVVSSHISNNAGDAAIAGETEASIAYAEAYLRELTEYLKSGTPLKKAISEVYVYQLFDGGTDTEGGNHTSDPLVQWGIMNPNLTMKYNIDFSDVSCLQSVLWNRISFLAVLVVICLHL